MSVYENALMQGMGAGGVGATGGVGRSAAQKRNEREEALRLAQAEARTSSGEKIDDKKLRGVAEEFVSVFMNQVMKSMRETVQENPAMHGDNGETFFRDMLDTEYAGKMSKGSGYGLTDLVYQALASKSRVQPLEDAAADAKAGEALADAVLTDVPEVKLP